MIDGAYDGTRLNCTNQAVLTEKGLDKGSDYNLPLEIMPSGQFEPLYRTALNVQVNIACFDALNNTLSYFLKFKKKKRYLTSSFFNFHLEGWRIAGSSFISIWSCCNGT